MIGSILSRLRTPSGGGLSAAYGVVVTLAYLRVLAYDIMPDRLTANWYVYQVMIVIGLVGLVFWTFRYGEAKAEADKFNWDARMYLRALSILEERVHPDVVAEAIQKAARQSAPRPHDSTRNIFEP